MKVVWFVLCAALACGAGCKKAGTDSKSSSPAESSSESAGAGAGEAVTLRAKWPVGNRYSQRMEVNGDTQTHMAQSPKPMQQKVTMSQEYSITVLAERPKGGRELELEFEAAEIDVTMNGKPVVNLDTKAEAGPTETAKSGMAGFREIVGAKLKFLLDESNRVEKVEGIKEFTAKATAGSNPQGRATMQSMFNEEYFKQMVESQRSLPPKPVKIGESWPVKTELTVPVLGIMSIDLNYTLKGWEVREKRKCAVIDFAGTMTSKGAPNAAAAPAAMSMSVENGKLSGKTWFDPDLGSTIETSVHQDMVLHMTMPVPRRRETNATPQAAATQSITNNTKQNVVIKLVDVVSAAK